jgi:hypothetical protein
MLASLLWHLFFLCLHAGEFKFNYHYSSIKLNSLLWLFLSLTATEGNLSTNAHRFRFGVGQPAEPMAAAIVDIHFHTQAEPLNSPLKCGHFLLEVGFTVLWGIDCPYPLCMTNNNPYFPFLKPLHLFFVHCKLTFRPGYWFSSNKLSSIRTWGL